MQDAVARPETQQPKGYALQPSRRALVIDTDDAARQHLCDELAALGYLTEAVISVFDGLQMAREQRPDFVLIGVDDEPVESYNAASVIKREAGERFVPVVFLTTARDPDVFERCIASGGDDLLQKPLDSVVFRAKMRSLERIRSLHSELLAQKTTLDAHQEQQQREFEITERIFSNILDRGVLEWPMFKHLHSPMAVFNGDMLLATPTPDGGLRVLVGDFTGHGLVASIGTVPVAEVFYGMTAKGFSIAELLTEINSKIRQLLPRGRFLAATVLQLDATHQHLQVWNGGLPDVLIFGNESGKTRHVAKSLHLPLGVLESADLELTTERFDVDLGDRIYAYSDGVLEATNPAGTAFGEAGLQACLAVNSPDQIFTAIESALDAHRAGRAQEDDITLVEIVCTGSPVAEQAECRRGAAPQRAATTWDLQLTMHAACLKSADPLPLLTHFVQEHQGLRDHRERIFVVLSELYNNALDHGLLRLESQLKNGPEGFAEYFEERERRLDNLASGEVCINIHNRPAEEGEGGVMTIQVSDSGSGFQVGARDTRIPADTGALPHGRGLELVRGLCSSLRYNQRGNQVAATYVWS